MTWHPPLPLGLLPHLKTVQVRLQLLKRLDMTNNDLAILPFTLGLLLHLKTVQVRLQLLKRLDMTNNDLASSPYPRPLALPQDCRGEFATSREAGSLPAFILHYTLGLRPYLKSRNVQMKLQLLESLGREQQPFFFYQGCGSA